MPVRLALAGDTMLGRKVAERLAADGPDTLLAPEVVAVAAEADLMVCNLECCVSSRGRRWPDPAKPFFFRAPPVATKVLGRLGVDCVTLANNHALDFSEEALLDTFGHLESAGIAWVGAGPDLARARQPVVLQAAGLRVAVIGVADHPEDFAAGPDHAGIAYADLRDDVPAWLTGLVASADADITLVTPHWGPNMVAEPVPHVRAAAAALQAAGATIIVGHSAHVFHGVGPGGVLFDLGDFLDDYAVNPTLRNDVGLLWLVDVDATGLRRVEAVPLALDYCHTRLGEGDDAAWVRRRFREACARLGTNATEEDGRLVVDVAGQGR
ncbi:MAG TPA: CapA family protein [Egibacteraceae bacterium]|nr:CapA family protein [Actinomycetota bacterium]HWB70860.1 CapA family protein [Egibacteraceae bacterium]